MTYWKRLIVEWNACRIVRIIAGVPIMIMGLQQGDWPVILFGGGFLALGLFTTQCCSSAGCNTSYLPANKKTSEIDFEEIKN